MKKILILIPVFNDWRSISKLIYQINENIKEIKEFVFECFIINDASSENYQNLSKPNNIKSIKIFNMRKNKGHARCNAFGLRYVIKNEKFDNIILMDGDGEDRPEEIKDLVKEIEKDPKHSVVARRVKRSEGVFFSFLYQMHKLITYIFTGKMINFGNYCCLTKTDVKQISSKPSLWSSFSGTLKRYIKKINTINSTRGLRYFGPSKMSLYRLLIHSFSIIAVFKSQVFVRSAIMILALIFLKSYFGFFGVLLQFLLVIFCIVILIVSFREKEKDLINSENNLENIKNITH